MTCPISTCRVFHPRARNHRCPPARVRTTHLHPLLKMLMAPITAALLLNENKIRHSLLQKIAAP